MGHEEDTMADVTVHPGGVVTDRADGRNTWTFTVTVDGQVGTVEAEAPADWSEEKARAALQRWFDKHPEEVPSLGGVASTGVSDEGEETSTGGDDGEDDSDDDSGNDDDDGDDTGDDDGESGGDE